MREREKKQGAEAEKKQGAEAEKNNKYQERRSREQRRRTKKNQEESRRIKKNQEESRRNREKRGAIAPIGNSLLHGLVKIKETLLVQTDAIPSNHKLIRVMQKAFGCFKV